MVRTTREPNLTTPQLLRISTSAATSSRRSSGGSPSQPLFAKFRTPSLSSSQNSSSNDGTVKKRSILGEREENIILPSQARPVKSPKSKIQFRTSITPRSSKSNNDVSNPNLSRFIVKSPIKNLPPSRYQDTPSSSSIGNSPNLSFVSRPGSTPYLPRPRQSMSMEMGINEDDTLLLDMRAPEMNFSSPNFDLTDDSDVEEPRGGIRGRGGLMTPANSQEVPSGSPRRASTVRKPTLQLTAIRNPISRLPTPPSSQSGSQPNHCPPTPQAGPSRVSRIRARLSPTPPRRISTEPSHVIGLGDITAEWDTPLRLGDDISPNPRRKKSPRLSQPGQTPTRLKSPSVQQQTQVEVVIPIRARSNTPGNLPKETPATVKPRAKGRTSSKSPNLNTSTSSRRSSGESRRSSGGSTKAAAIAATPAASRATKKIPSTAPVGRRKSTPPITARKIRTTPPSQSSRRASVPANTKTPRGRPRKSIAQTPKDVALTGRKLGMLPRPIHGSPGDDPLLLKGRDAIDLRRTGIRDNTGLSLTFDGSSLNQHNVGSLSTSQIRNSSPFNYPQHDEDITLLPMNSNNNSYFDMGPSWSDNDSDMEGVGEDTFINIPNRKENSGVLGRRNIPVLEEDEDEEREELGDQTIGGVDRSERSDSPLLPPRKFTELPTNDMEEHARNQDTIQEDTIQATSPTPAEHIAEAQDASFSEAGDVTEEIEQSNWDISQDEIDHTNPVPEEVPQPQSVRARSRTPANAENNVINESDAMIQGLGEIDSLWEKNIEAPQMKAVEPTEVVPVSPKTPVEEDIPNEDVGDKTQEMLEDDWNTSADNIPTPFASSALNITRSQSPTPASDHSSSKRIKELVQAIHNLSDLTPEEPIQPVQTESVGQNTATSEQLVHDSANQLEDNGEVEQGDISQENTNENWELSEDKISQSNENIGHHSRPNNPIETTPTNEQQEIAKELAEEPQENEWDLSEDGIDPPQLHDSSPYLSESEEMGDVTQDMDVLDWGGSEEDDHSPQAHAEDPTQSQLSSSIVGYGTGQKVDDLVQEDQNEEVNPIVEGPIVMTIEGVVVVIEQQVEVSHSAEEFDEQESTADGMQDREIEEAESAEGLNHTENADDEPNQEALASTEKTIPTLDMEVSRSTESATTPFKTPIIPSIPLLEEPSEAIAPTSPTMQRSTTPTTTPIPTIYRSTTPSFSPPPSSFETRSMRSPSVPRSPFVLIHHRGNLAFTPQPVFPSTSYRSPSPLPPPTPVFTAEERGHAILEEADRAIRRLSRLRSLSPNPPITGTENMRVEALGPVVEEESQSLSGEEVDQDQPASPIEANGPVQQEVADNLDEDEEDLEDDSTIGDVTIEADSSAWNLSSEDFEVPLRDESEGEDEMEEGGDDMVNQGSPVHAGENAQEAQGEETDLAAEGEAEEEEEVENSPAPVEVPERIILCLVERGIIKLEPRSDSEDLEDNSSEPDQFPSSRSNVASSSSHIQPSSPIPESSQLNARSKTPSPAPTTFAGPSTPSVYPSLPLPNIQSQPESSTPKTAPPSSVFRYGNSTTQGVNTLERMLLQRGVTSKLSQQILPSSPSTEPESSPIQRESSPAEDSPAQSSSSGPNDENEEGDESIVIRKPRRSLHDELAAVNGTIPDDEDFQGDDSFRSVVEVSSLDPKAAARAAAILKLNHAYIEHGVLPKPGTLASSSSSALSKSKSTSHSDKEKRDLLHEAELEIVESHRRSRSRSMSRLPDQREREMSVMSFMTEDYLIPGAFIKTPHKSPMKRKRDLLTLIENREESSNRIDGEVREKKNEDKWGINEWKKLEKLYRKEKQFWIKEREIKSLPSTNSYSNSNSIHGGLVAWARRSTFGSTSSSNNEVKAKEWDIQIVIKKFMDDEKKEGRFWDEDMLVLRVQAIERRITKLSSSTTSTSTAMTSDPQTPAPKKVRPNLTSEITKDNSAIDQTPTINKTTIEPPSTIKRMLGFVWGKSKSTPKPKQSSLRSGNLTDKFESSKPTQSSKGKGKEREVLPTTEMREIRSQSQAPAHPRSTQWTPISAPPPSGPSRSIPIPVSSSSTSRGNSSIPTLTYSTSLPSMETSTTSSYTKLYPSLTPSISQRSNAIAKLFPNQTGSSTSINSSTSSSFMMTASTSEKNLRELEKIKDQRKRNGSVKDLVKGWEGKGIIGSSVNGKNQ